MRTLRVVEERYRYPPMGAVAIADMCRRPIHVHQTRDGVWRIQPYDVHASATGACVLVRVRNACHDRNLVTLQVGTGIGVQAAIKHVPLESAVVAVNFLSVSGIGAVA